MTDREWGREPRARRGGSPGQSPNSQVLYGCLVIAVIGTAVLYCAGSISMLMRPSFLARPATPTVVVRPTLGPSPTQPPPTLINLPPGVLLATPTQAPIPTRDLSTLTPTVDLTNPAPSVTVTTTGVIRITPTPTSSPRTTATPPRRVTATNTPKP